jgi:hypothetical protein
MAEKGTFTELTSGYSGGELNKMFGQFPKKKAQRTNLTAAPESLRTTHHRDPYTHTTSLARAPLSSQREQNAEQSWACRSRECPLRAIRVVFFAFTQRPVILRTHHESIRREPAALIHLDPRAVSQMTDVPPEANYHSANDGANANSAQS